VWKLSGQENLHEAYIALGSNIGDREKNLRAALKKIDVSGGLRITGISNLYETEPVGYREQGRFLNMACKITTSMEPLTLLSLLQKIEDELGRKRTVHWGPRTIDLDILLFDNRKIISAVLTIPHPRMFERAFVLAPLRDVFLQAEFDGNSINQLIEKCGDRAGLTLYKRKENFSSFDSDPAIGGL
jgi:2-amino-4-hydroxy-6-hydroxymethyldihydropteridine diphosphokinase